MTKLLIVDDNEQNLYLLRVLMEGHGYEVDTAVNGAEALEMARQHPPDMIVSDILMPVMDGFTLCREWKQDKDLKDIPFVFYTATYTDPKDEEFALSLGAERFIVKPVEPDAFVEMLEEVIADHQAGHLTPSRGPSIEEPEVFREYSERLIKKLEDKMLQLEQSNRSLYALYQASIGLVSIRSLNELVQHALDTAVEAMGYTSAGFFVYDEEGQKLRLLEAVGFSSELAEKFRQKLVFNLGEERGLVGLVAQSREMLIIADVREDPRWIPLDGTIRSALFVPVAHEERLFGVASLLSDEVGAFDDDDERVVLTLANNMASAMENIQLLDRVMTQNLQLLKLNRAIEQAAEAVVITDPSGNIEYVNPAFERITGYSRDEAFGQNPRILKSGQQDEAFYESLWKTILEGQVWHGSLINRKKSGDLYHEEMTIAPVLDESKNVVNFVAIKHDITERVRFEELLRRQIDFLEAVRAIDKTIIASADLSQSIVSILDKVCQILEVDAASILLYNPTTLTLECAGRKGFKTSALQHVTIHLGQGLGGQAALERRIVSTMNFQADGEEFQDSPDLPAENFVSYFGVPLIAKGELKGVLEIFHRSPLSQDDEWLTFLDALAGQAAIAIDNAGLFVDLQQANIDLRLAYDKTLEGWAKALELRDVETEGHSHRVTEMTVQLARTMGIDEAELVHVRRGALLHDIGKMGIPDSILLKPGKLTDQEWDIMHQHPVYSYDMLSPIAYLEPTLDIPHYHHEKWDGTGYPQGLKGEQIPLSARIFAVVDVWDALLSDRPYRKAWSQQKALEYIREQADKHFDPQVTEAFVSMVERQAAPPEVTK